MIEKRKQEKIFEENTEWNDFFLFRKCNAKTILRTWESLIKIVHKIRKLFTLVSFGLVGFYHISNIVGHLIPNSVYTYILNI